jgi:hypothetical protein
MVRLLKIPTSPPGLDINFAEKAPNPRTTKAFPVGAVQTTIRE